MGDMDSPWAPEAFDPTNIDEELEHMGAGDPTDQPIVIDIPEKEEQDAGA